MKIVGVLRVKDEADLLPSVLENVAEGVDEIYAYDDGSTDATVEILEDHPKVTYLTLKDSSYTMELQMTQHLETTVKQRHPEYKTEEVWVALLAGDLWWESHTPRQAAIEAVQRGHDMRTGVAIDFGRWSWNGFDDWPHWHFDIRDLCNWCAIIEQLPVVWKVADYTTWKRLPWPRSLKNRWTGIDEDSVFLHHYGKRSPSYNQWKYLHGGRTLPRGTTLEDWESWQFAYDHGKSLGYWENTRRIPWEGPETVARLLEIEKMSEEKRLALYATYDGRRIDP